MQGSTSTIDSIGITACMAIQVWMGTNTVQEKLSAILDRNLTDERA